MATCRRRLFSVWLSSSEFAALTFFDQHKNQGSRVDYWQRTVAAKAAVVHVIVWATLIFQTQVEDYTAAIALKLNQSWFSAFKAREEKERKKKEKLHVRLRLNRQHPAKPHLYLISAEISVEAQQRCIKCNCFHAKTNISRAPCAADGLCCSLKQTSNLHSNLLLSSAGAAFEQTFFFCRTFETFFRKQRNVFTCTLRCEMIYERPLMW